MRPLFSFGDWGRSRCMCGSWAVVPEIGCCEACARASRAAWRRRKWEQAVEQARRAQLQSQKVPEPSYKRGKLKRFQKLDYER